MIDVRTEKCPACGNNRFTISRLIYSTARIEKPLYVGTISKCCVCNLRVFHPQMQVGVGVYGFDGMNKVPITDERFYAALGDLIYGEDTRR